jgi:hypothetical protein
MSVPDGGENSHVLQTLFIVTQSHSIRRADGVALPQWTRKGANPKGPAPPSLHRRSLPKDQVFSEGALLWQIAFW